MNIEEKISVLESAYHDFFGDTKVLLIEEILLFLRKSNEDFHLSFCYYVHDYTIENDFKFIVSSANKDFLYSLGLLLGTDGGIQRWKNIFEISFRFDTHGFLKKYGFYLVQYQKDIIVDIRLNHSLKNESEYEIQKSRYIHLYEKNYSGDKKIVGEYRGYSFLDIVYIQKRFLHSKDETLYFIQPSRLYTRSRVEKDFRITCPSYLSKDFSLYATCILKDELHQERFTYFSLYFGTY